MFIVQTTWGTRDHKFVDDVERMFIVLFPLVFDFDMVHIALESETGRMIHEHYSKIVN